MNYPDISVTVAHFAQNLHSNKKWRTVSLYLGGEKGERWTEAAGSGGWEWLWQVGRQHHRGCHRDDQVGRGCPAWDHVAIRQKIAIYFSLSPQKRTSSTSKLEFSSLFWVILALLDPDPDPYADPDPADRNECGSGSATLEEGSRDISFWRKVFCTVLYLTAVMYCTIW